MKKRILVVDDERDILEVVSKRLEMNEYEVLRAQNGEEAISLANEHVPDLIVLDILMPGIDGAQVEEQLKENKTTENIPIIFLTCLVTKDDEKETNVRGGNFFLAKPYEADELINAIEQQLREKDN